MHQIRIEVNNTRFEYIPHNIDLQESGIIYLIFDSVDSWADTNPQLNITPEKVNVRLTMNTNESDATVMYNQATSSSFEPDVVREGTLRLFDIDTEITLTVSFNVRNALEASEEITGPSNLKLAFIFQGERINKPGWVREISDFGMAL